MWWVENVNLEAKKSCPKDVELIETRRNQPGNYLSKPLPLLPFQYSFRLRS